MSQISELQFKYKTFKITEIKQKSEPEKIVIFDKELEMLSYQ